MTTGFLGTKPLLPVLADTGQLELAGTILHPHIPTTGDAPITWVKAHHDSPHGRIAVSWKRQDDGSLLYEATIPPNTTAELTLPKTSPWSQGDRDTETKHLSPGSHHFVVK